MNIDEPIWRSYSVTPEDPTEAYGGPIQRPILPIRLTSLKKQNVRTAKLIVDSGAELTLFTWPIVRLLNIGEELSDNWTDRVRIGGKPRVAQ